MDHIHCIKCGGKTANKEKHPMVREARNGARMALASCSRCGSKKSRFLPGGKIHSTGARRKGKKSGKGIFDAIKSLFGGRVRLPGGALAPNQVRLALDQVQRRHKDLVERRANPPNYKTLGLGIKGRRKGGSIFDTIASLFGGRVNMPGGRVNMPGGRISMV